jgi:hypothetical protein
MINHGERTMHANALTPHGIAEAHQLGANRPQSTLESAVSCAHTAANDLQAAVEMLSGRLQAVMAPPAPQPQTGQTGNGRNLASVESPHSPAVNDLHALRSRIEMLTNQINSIASVLET